MICFIDAKLSANTYFYAHKPIINQTRIFRTSALLSLYIDEFLLVFLSMSGLGINLARNKEKNI